MIGSHTYRDWLVAPDPEGTRYTELLFGHLRPMPFRSVRHQRAMTRLTFLIDDALKEVGRTDLHTVWSVNVRMPVAMRTVLIPDVVVVRGWTDGLLFRSDALELAVEVWSSHDEDAFRETRLAAYAMAGVPFVWALGQEGDPVLTAYRLVRHRYVTQNTVCPGRPTVVRAAPFPITVDLNSLLGW